jgi:hypothetical protein
MYRYSTGIKISTITVLLCSYGDTAVSLDSSAFFRVLTVIQPFHLVLA